MTSRKVEGAIQQSLGEPRYAEFKRGEDEDYHRLNALATRYKLPKEKAVEAYGYKKIVGDYRAQVRADPNLNPQQKSEALKDIGTETEKALQSLQASKIAVAQNRAKLTQMRDDAQAQVSTGTKAATRSGTRRVVSRMT